MVSTRISTPLIFLCFLLSIVVCSKNNNEGDMIRVTGRGTISVLLDEIKRKKDRSKFSKFIKNMEDKFWLDRVETQLLLVQYRLTFRPVFNDENPAYGQLNLPPFNQINVTFKSMPKHMIIDGHHHIGRTYNFETFIVGKKGSAQLADPNFSSIGGVVFENFTLPADPQLLVQRTGYACMDEDQFPLNSVDPEAQDIYYDDSCEAEEPFEGGVCSQCHCCHRIMQRCFG
jgi:hypothetical protein